MNATHMTCSKMANSDEFMLSSSHASKALFSADCVAPLPSSHNSLEYAAPEIIAGIKPGVATCASATAAADMWALGMVAFELLTNEPLFAPGTAPKTIRAALAGRKPLPWEDGAGSGILPLLD